MRYSKLLFNFFQYQQSAYHGERHGYSPEDNEKLLGAIPLEDIDVIIHPQRQELIVNPDHPYFAQMKMK